MAKILIVDDEINVRKLYSEELRGEGYETVSASTVAEAIELAEKESPDLMILDMKLGGKVYDTRTPAQDGGLAIWVGAGARYWDNDVDYKITIDPILPGNDPIVTTGKTGETWWDPVLGLHMHFPVTPSVGFSIRATGGGLGIGEASDYMWDAEFAALFRLSRRLMLSAGYRQFKYKRTDGSGDDEIVQSVTVVGPSIGLSIGIF